MADTRLSRRQLLARGAAAGGAIVVGGRLAAFAGSKTRGPSRHGVVIVGAGLAGLSCAYRLHEHGVAAHLYEARPDRVGGRCWTAREFAGGQVAEHGGEFIDSDHAATRRLVRELGLELEDRRAFERLGGGHSLLYLDGALRHEEAVLRHYPTVLRRLRRVARRTGYNGSYASAKARAFDSRDARSWLRANVPGGDSSLLGRVMREYLSGEFGLDAELLTATDLLYLTEGPRSGDGPAETDPSDERFHIRGGNDQVPQRLAERLPAATLHMGAALEAVWRRGEGDYGLRFSGVRGIVIAKQVVLAIPFTTLRDVDLERSGLGARKREAIEQLGMGTNTKVLLQFANRPARFGNWNGELVTDRPYHDTWETSLTQPGGEGLITVYSGGAVGAGYAPGRAHGRAPERVVRRTLAALERAVPGIIRDFNGRAWLDDWGADRWTKGSYAAFLPGQYTRFGFAIARPEGGLHFAGEHTSDAYQGFLEGAVRSGERCAREVRGLR